MQLKNEKTRELKRVFLIEPLTIWTAIICNSLRNLHMLASNTSHMVVNHLTLTCHMKKIFSEPSQNGCKLTNHSPKNASRDSLMPKFTPEDLQLLTGAYGIYLASVMGQIGSCAHFHECLNHWHQPYGWCKWYWWVLYSPYTFIPSFGITRIHIGFVLRKSPH